MALKNLFDMVKADKYTADGREAIIKAREAETEDVKYQNGDISQKTGLMKTPNGWVEPPKGKQPAAKKSENKGSTAQRMKAYVDRMNKQNGEYAGSYKRSKEKADAMKQEQLAELNRANTENKPAAGSKKGQVLNTFKTGNAGGSKWDVNITGGENDLANEFFEQHGARFNFRGKDVNVDDYIKPIDKNSFELKLWDSGNESKGYYGKLVGKGNNTDMRYIVTKTPSGWDLKKTERRYYGMPNSEKNYKLDNNKYTRTQDSAPRALTGDTKIRVRKA